MVSLKDSVDEIVRNHPEAVDILVGLGFSDIANPLMRSTVGKFMTLPKASGMKKIPLEEILRAFSEKGIEVMV